MTSPITSFTRSAGSPALRASPATSRAVCSACFSISRRCCSSAARCASTSGGRIMSAPACGTGATGAGSAHTRPPVMAPGFQGRSSPASRTTTPVSGLSRAILTPSPIFPASRLSPLRLFCSATNRASSLPIIRPPPPIASSRPSRSVSGLSQIPAAFPFLSNAGSATCG
ncbi:Uncharacterised protein [Klebsiella pneumoniae]|nr:Uncharacterised protein [Klebsiella pneumoniae]